MIPVDEERLRRVQRWGDLPFAERSEEWAYEFESAFWPALLFSPPDGILNGSQDGRPYRLISLPPKDFSQIANPETAFTRPASIVDSLIENGQGLLFGEPGVTKCVFSLGAVLAYRLYGRAFSKPPEQGKAVSQISAGETILIAPVNEATFPHWVRINVRCHLQTSLGIVEPRAVWAQFPDGQSGLVFDVDAPRVNDEAQILKAFSELRWFLPASISYFRIDILAGDQAMRPF